MKTNRNVSLPEHFISSLINIGLLITALLFITLGIEAKAQTVSDLSMVATKSDLSFKLPNKVLSTQAIDCEEDLCQQLIGLCENEGQCLALVEFCLENPQHCQVIMQFLACEFGEEDNCEEFTQCDEDEEECNEVPECNEEEEDCAEVPECNEEEEDCAEVPECNEEEEDCQQPPVCTDEEEDECNAVVSTGFENLNPVANNRVKKR